MPLRPITVKWSNKAQEGVVYDQFTTTVGRSYARTAWIQPLAVVYWPYILYIDIGPRRAIFCIITWLPNVIRGVKINVLSYPWFTTSVSQSAFRPRTTQFILINNAFQIIAFFLRSGLQCIFHQASEILSTLTIVCSLSSKGALLCCISIISHFRQMDCCFVDSDESLLWLCWYRLDSLM